MYSTKSLCSNIGLLCCALLLGNANADSSCPFRLGAGGGMEFVIVVASALLESVKSNVELLESEALLWLPLLLILILLLLMDGVKKNPLCKSVGFHSDAVIR